MSAAPPLSAVMPVHNGLPHVEDSLASVLAQTFKDFEFVIGDDGCDDGTAERLRSCARRDGRIRLARRERKSGLVAAGNWVVGLARAPLVAIVHADDLCHRERFERQVEALRRRPDASAVGALSQGIDGAGRIVHPPDRWRLLPASPFAPFVHSTLMFRRASFHRAGGYRSGTDYWEDLDLYWRLLETGPILVVPEPLGSYRHSAASARTREAEAGVDGAVDRMFRSAALYRRGEDHAPLLAPSGAPSQPKLLPRTLVARSWTDIWSGRPPGTLKRLLRRGRLRLDRSSLYAIAFLAAAETSPRLLRALVSGFMKARNLCARPALAGREAVEWRTRRAARPDAASAPERAR